ncbi:uncharacterized protein LOC119173543 isoform X3 [Rhipicephalus microplus]|uniref:uncharacterized protein LOC119173543 isoform X3 n=1 Tax=Rhipicephalus microplus TaxID=6941 RepID=UPI003F6CB432
MTAPAAFYRLLHLLPFPATFALAHYTYSDLCLAKCVDRFQVTTWSDIDKKAPESTMFVPLSFVLLAISASLFDEFRGQVLPEGCKQQEECYETATEEIFQVVEKHDHILPLCEALKNDTGVRGCAAEYGNGSCDSNPWKQPVNALVESLCSEKSLPSERRLEELRVATAKDPALSVIRSYAETDWPENKEDVPACARPLWAYREEMHTQDGLVFRSNKKLMGRQTRTLLPVPSCHLKPAPLPKRKVHSRLQEIRHKQKVYYNRGAWDLRALSPGQRASLYDTHTRTWSPVVVLGSAGAPRSVLVKTEDGREMRRTRERLREVPELPCPDTTTTPSSGLPGSGHVPEPPLPRISTRGTSRASSVPHARATYIAPRKGRCNRVGTAAIASASCRSYVSVTSPAWPT